MVAVEIEYCSMCGTLSQAQNLSQELLAALGGDVEGVEVTNRREHVFRVRVDDEVVYEDDDEELVIEDVEAAVREHLDDGKP